VPDELRPVMGKSGLRLAQVIGAADKYLLFTAGFWLDFENLCLIGVDAEPLLREFLTLFPRPD
jgi:hypothetical protein